MAEPEFISEEMNMNLQELFRSYVNERRDQEIDGFERVQLPHLVRYTAVQQGRDGFILFADLSPSAEREQIRDQVRFYAERSQAFEWQSTFADLHGGAVLSTLRGKGIYSLLFYDRCQEAQRRGYQYLAVDAAPMSRPILEQKGFQLVCFTYPMRQISES
jgi:GNAT superfamily N-acetyltransferase